MPSANDIKKGKDGEGNEISDVQLGDTPRRGRLVKPILVRSIWRVSRKGGRSVPRCRRGSECCHPLTIFEVGICVDAND